MLLGAFRRGWRWLMHRALGSSTRFVYGRHYGLALPDSSFDAQRADRILSFLLEERLVINATGPETLRFLPPLIVAESDVDDAVARLGAVLGP